MPPGTALPLPVAYRAAVGFEQALGDPARADNTLSFARAMALDEDEAFPEEALALLQRLAQPASYVPQAEGGTFASSETFLALGRSLARRDMSVAVSVSTLLWSMLAWIGGDAAQRRQVAQWMTQDGEFPCLAYSEAAHGADLSANELTATRQADGSYLLHGEKWPINRATRSGFVVLLARTDTGEHLRNHSLFVLQKSALQPAPYALPRARTLGLRGCDISGIGFRGSVVPAHCRLGAEGAGLELALKGFQVTRTFCTALSLGAGDTALRLVAEFAAQRQLYGGTVASLPQARDVLANAYLSQLMAECVSMVAARGLHLHAGQFASWASIAKVQTTRLVDTARERLAALLGARAYLREGIACGMFQKIVRDAAIVAVFDGSTAVCLDSLATLMRPMALRRAALPPGACDDTSALYDLQQPLPPLPFGRLDLHGRGRDAVAESLPGLRAQLDALRPDTHCDATTLERLQREAEGLQADLAQLDAETLAEPLRRGERNSARSVDRAERYCAVHGAIAALGLWLHSRGHRDAFFAAGHWLQAVLMRRGAAECRAGALPSSLVETLYRQLETQCLQQRMLSLLDWPLAAPGLAESDLAPSDKKNGDMT